jgi:Carboxypeptidase regulatory-like domain
VLIRIKLSRGTIRVISSLPALRSGHHGSIGQNVLLVGLLLGAAACAKTPTETHSPLGTFLEATCVPAGDDVSCTAILSGDGPTRDVTAVATWLASDPAIGRFVSPGLFTPTEPGRVELWARYGAWESLKSSFLVNPGGSPQRLYFLSGLVTDDATMAPIVGATVQILDGFARGAETTTNEYGAYEIDGILTGEVFTIAASKSGYESSTKSYRVDSPIGPGGGNPPFLDFSLHRQS